MKKVIFLMGPTACGKTELAINIAAHCNCEIISVDSALIYRSMNIGTAKPDQQTLSRTPHRLIDLLDPGQRYSVADFCKDAIVEIEDILGNGKIPLLVGGTIMYFRALQQGLSELPAADNKIRKMLSDRGEQEGWNVLHRELIAIDPLSAKKIHQNDSQRIQRALEVYQVSGQTLSALKASRPKHNFDYRVLKFIVSYQQRSALAEPIATRFQQMLDAGLIQEVEALRRRQDLSLDLPSMRCVGYRQVWEFLDGQYSYQEMSDRVVQATRQLAKRQYTWLRDEADSIRYYLEAGNPVAEITKKIMQFLESE